MSLNIPSRQELYNSIISDLNAELGVTIPQFGKSPLRAFALVQAGKLHLYWQAIALVIKNIFPDTADPESIGGTLERFGRAFLNRSRFSAVQAVYDVTVTGQVGATIAADTVFIADDSSSNPGANFVLDIETTLSAASQTVSLRALSAGVASRLSVSDTLTSGSPLLNIDDQVTILTETTAPEDEETIANYRAAILRSIRLEPQGGSATDYRLWSSDAQNIVTVYPYVAPNVASTVDLYIEATQGSSSDGKGSPTQAQLDDVRSVVELNPDVNVENRGRKPLTAVVNYLSIAPQDVLIDINGAATIPPGVRTTITNSLIQAIDQIRPFVESIDFEQDRNDTISVNQMITIVQQLLSTGETFTSLDLTIGGVPVTTSLQFINGDIPFLDPSDVTFNS